MYGVEGFRGNERGYYDPRNSHLNEVLDRRLGIPITLSAVYIEVARRVGLPAEGVGLPGHFLVKVPSAGGGLLLDPFAGGVKLTGDDRQARPTACTATRGDFDRAFDTAGGILALEPSSLTDLRGRGLPHYRQNRFPEALSDLRKCLMLARDPEDREPIKQAIRANESIQSMIRQLD